MGAVARIFADSVMGWYRRRLALGVPGARGGVVTVRPKTDEVGDVLQVARVRILRYLVRRGVVRHLPEALEINDELPARDRGLVLFFNNHVRGQAPRNAQRLLALLRKAGLLANGK